MIIGAAAYLYFSQPFSHEYRKPLRSGSWSRLQAYPVVTGITLSVVSISGMKGSLFATFFFFFFDEYVHYLRFFFSFFFFFNAKGASQLLASAIYLYAGIVLSYALCFL